MINKFIFHTNSYFIHISFIFQQIHTIYCSYCEDCENISASQAAIERNVEVLKNIIESTEHPYIIPIHLQITNILNTTVVAALKKKTKKKQSEKPITMNYGMHSFPLLYEEETEWSCFCKWRSEKIQQQHN